MSSVVHSTRTRCQIYETGQSCIFDEYMIVSTTTEDETGDGQLEVDSSLGYNLRRCVHLTLSHQVATSD